MATSKQVRKLESTTQGEVLEVEMAIRDEDGKRIKSNYATKSELTAAQTALGNAGDANTAAISGLAERVGTAETNIASNTTAISNEATARENAVSSEASTRASADTALGTRIDNEASTRASADTALGTRIDTLEDDVEGLESDMQENFQRVEEVAQGASRTFVLQATGLDENNNNNQESSFLNGLFGGNADVIEPIYYGGGSETYCFAAVECPRGSLPDAYVSQKGLTANVAFIPEGLTTDEKAAVVAKIPAKYSNADIQLVEIHVGDNVLIKEVGYPDRWLGAIDLQNKCLFFYRMEMSKVNIESLNTAINGKMDNKTIDSAPTAGNTTHLVSSAGVATALAGKQNTLTFDNAPTANSNNPVKSGGIHTALAAKQNTLTFDTTPTANSSNPVTSGGVKSALDNMQADLHVQSTVIGSVSIND